MATSIPQNNDVVASSTNTTTTLTTDSEVEQAYQIVLGRGSDAAGKAFWVHELETNHINYAELVHNLSTSAEGQEHAHTVDNSTTPTPSTTLSTDSEVEQAYQIVLGRDSDAAGKAFWVHELETGHMNYAELINNFSASAEGQEVEVEHAYQTVLGRNSDAAGKAFWVHELETGHVDHTALINDLSASAEGQAHVSLTGVQTVSDNPVPHG